MAEPEVTFMFSEGAEPSPFGSSRRKDKKKKKKGGGLAGNFPVQTYRMPYCNCSRMSGFVTVVAVLFLFVFFY